MNQEHIYDIIFKSLSNIAHVHMCSSIMESHPRFLVADRNRALAPRIINVAAIYDFIRLTLFHYYLILMFL